MIAYSEEDTGNQTWADNSLPVSGNLFENTNYYAIGVNNWSDGVTAVLSCNAFDGVERIANGSATLENNIIDGGVPACGQQSAPEPPGMATTVAGLALLALIRSRGRLRGPRRRLVA